MLLLEGILRPSQEVCRFIQVAQRTPSLRLNYAVDKVDADHVSFFFVCEILVLSV